jgi:hypothetical protein
MELRRPVRVPAMVCGPISLSGSRAAPNAEANVDKLRLRKEHGCVAGSPSLTGSRPLSCSDGCENRAAFKEGRVFWHEYSCVVWVFSLTSFDGTGCPEGRAAENCLCVYACELAFGGISA